MVQVQINWLILTVLPISTETGRCFQELFWSCCPSVTWTGQSCCQKPCAGRWITAGIGCNLSIPTVLLPDSMLTQTALIGKNKSFHIVYETFLTLSCPYKFIYSHLDSAKNYRPTPKQMADICLAQGHLNSADKGHASSTLVLNCLGVKVTKLTRFNMTPEHRNMKLEWHILYSLWGRVVFIWLSVDSITTTNSYYVWNMMTEISRDAQCCTNTYSS